MPLCLPPPAHPPAKTAMPNAAADTADFIRSIALSQNALDVAAHVGRRYLANDDLANNSAAIDEDVHRQSVHVELVAQCARVDNDRVAEMVLAAKRGRLAAVL